MRYDQLSENRIGPTENFINKKFLYHLTDNFGIGYAIENNEIKAIRQNYISTTTRKFTSSILGRSHYYYKFVLDAQKLAKSYGVFPYDHRVTEIEQYSQKNVSANEAEIGIETKKISP